VIVGPDVGGKVGDSVHFKQSKYSGAHTEYSHTVFSINKNDAQ
jgi:hypothetical protein